MTKKQVTWNSVFQATLEGPGTCRYDSPSAAHSADGTWILGVSNLCSHCFSECSELTHIIFLPC